LWETQENFIATIYNKWHVIRKRLLPVSFCKVAETWSFNKKVYSKRLLMTLLYLLLGGYTLGFLSLKFAQKLPLFLQHLLLPCAFLLLAPRAFVLAYKQGHKALAIVAGLVCCLLLGLVLLWLILPAPLACAAIAAPFMQ
jgi:hypothetical protein